MSETRFTKWLVHLLALPDDLNIQHRGEYIQLMRVIPAGWIWANEDVPTCPDCGESLEGPWTDSRNDEHYVMCKCGSHFWPITAYQAVGTKPSIVLSPAALEAQQR